MTEPRHDLTMGIASAVGLVIRGQDASGDAASVADLVTVLARPLPDCAQVATTLATSRPRLARALASAGATGMAHPRGEVVAQLLGVGCGQVDLVGDAVERERYGLNRLCAVHVVNQHILNTLCHENSRMRNVYELMSGVHQLLITPPYTTILTKRNPVRRYCWIAPPWKSTALDRLPTWNGLAAHGGPLRALP